MTEYFQYVSIGLLAIIGVIVLFNAIKGLIRGLKKTVGTLIAIVLSAVIAGVVTLFVCKPSSELMEMVMRFLEEKVTLENLAQIFGIEELGVALGYYLSWIVAPLFFATAFVAISFIVSIIVAIVIRFVPPFKKPGVLANRLGAVGVGIFCGLLVSVIMLSPLGVVAGLVTDTELGDIIADSGEDAKEIVEFCESDKLVGVITVASTPVEKIFCSTTLEGEKVSLKNEIDCVASVVGNLETLGVPMEEYDDTQIVALDAVMEDFGKAGVLRNAFAGVLSAVSETWLAGEPFLGMEKISAGELLDPTIDKMLEIMKTSTKDTVDDDLGTVKDIFVVLIESELLTAASDSDNMLEKLGESGAISELLVVINSNPRMAPLADEIATLSIRALATSIGIPADADQAYNDLMGNIADVLTDSYGMSEDDRAAYVEKEVVSALDRYGINVEGEAAGNVAAAIIADLGDRATVDASDISEFFTVYAIASADESAALPGTENPFDFLSASTPSVEIKDNGVVVVNGRELKCYNSSDFRNSAAYQSGKSGVDFGGAATLYSAEGMETVLLTVADIIETLGSFADVEDIEAEAAKIGAIIARAADVFSGMDLENTEPSEILEKMGGVLDDMKATKIIGADSTANLIKALLQNEKVTKSIGISSVQASQFADKLGEIASKSETGYTDATVAVANTLNAVSVSKDSGKTAEEKKQASMDLINCMTSDNAELIGTLISGDMMANQGADSESAEQVSDVMNMLLTNMADYKSEDPDEASVSAEAEAVNHALSLAAMGADGLKDQTLFDTEDGQSGVLGSTPDAFIDTVVNSQVIMTTVEQAVYDKEMGQNPLGIPSLSESEEQKVTEALENYFDENGGGADLERKLEAIAAMVNIDLDIG